MTRPSSGVSPIVVSILRPCSTAHIDAPDPRWQTMAFTAVTGLPNAFANCFVNISVGRAVEAVAPYTMVVIQMLGQSVAVRFRRHARRMKSSVGHDDVRDAAPRVSGEADAERVRRVVERG